jgi:hypothetical protein
VSLNIPSVSFAFTKLISLISSRRIMSITSGGNHIHISQIRGMFRKGRVDCLALRLVTRRKRQERLLGYRWKGKSIPVTGREGP